MEVIVGVLISPAVSAAVSAAVSSAVSKLGRVIANRLVGNEARSNARDIRDELELIKLVISRRLGSYISPSQTPREWIRPLWRLAYEIEDCIDCFEVKKTNSERFGEQIVELKQRSEETHQLLLRYIQLDNSIPVPTSEQGQGQQLIAPAAAPNELQELLITQSEDWFKCLLYFCMFPHDHHASRNPLIRRWLAEGLVNEEDDAVNNLKTLTDRNIINTTARSNNGMMKRCQTPGEILKFINQRSSDTNFMLFCDDMANLQAEYTRRLSLHSRKETLDNMNLPDCSYLHTLAVFHGSANTDIYGTTLEFGNYEVLRVLDLKECAPLSHRHLLAICNLLLLKYLSFRGGSGTNRLPSEIRKLEWLETLDMRGSEIVTVYKQVLMMPRLKHLFGKFQLSRRHTIWFTAELEEFLKNKSVLQTLSGFATSKRRGFPQLMKHMRKLRKVKIWCKSNASAAKLGHISSAITKFIDDGLQIQEPARSLSINFQEGSGQLLNNVKPQQGGLTSLKLHGKLSEFPQFVARLGGIQELCLSSTGLTWNVILAKLSELKVLQYLKLVEDNLGRVNIQAGNLQSLKRLCLMCVPKLNIKIQAGSLPHLESLHIICQVLDVLPGTPGIEIIHMTKLQEVGLHSQVDQPIKQGWENAAKVHPNKPCVFNVHSP